MDSRSKRSKGMRKKNKERRNTHDNGCSESAKDEPSCPEGVGQKLKNSYNACNKKHFRWALELLHTAVCGHRWDEAFHLLPCVITQTASYITIDILWRLMDVITRNVSGITLDERKAFRSLLHRMRLKSSMFLDILSQDLAKATERDAEELLQMIEDIQNQRQHVQTGVNARVNKRVQALCDGYVGLIHFNRWKNSSAGLPNSVPPSQQVNESQVSVFESQDTTTTHSDQREMARTAYWYLKKALTALDEPCEWFMLQFLELEKELNGLESAINALEKYKNEEKRAPTHHLAYYFYKNLLPGSTDKQMAELVCISKESPDDPLVVELVNCYLHTLDGGGAGGLDHSVVWGSCNGGDSGLEEDSNDSFSPEPLIETTNEANTTEPTCTLKAVGRIPVLYKCTILLVAMLDYPNHVWSLKPWQKLTEVLTKFYQTWVRCWSCLWCRSTKIRIHRLAATIVPLWRHYVWKDPPDTLPKEKARILFHHVFAAFIFGYSKDYRKRSLEVLEASGHVRLKEELVSLMNFPGPYLKNFTKHAERNRRRLENISLKSLSQAVSETERRYQGSSGSIKNTKIRPKTASTKTSKRRSIYIEEENEESRLELEPLTPIKDTVNQESGMSPESSHDIFDISHDDNFITSTQTKDIRCKVNKKFLLLDDHELNGSYISSEQPQNNVRSASTSTGIKKNAESSENQRKVNDSNEKTSRRGSLDRNGMIKLMENDYYPESDYTSDGDEDTPTKKRTEKLNKVSKTKFAAPRASDPFQRTRLSRRKIYQPPKKRNRTPTSRNLSKNNSITDEDQNYSKEEISLTHRLDNDKNASEDNHFYDSVERAEDIIPEREREHSSIPSCVIPRNKEKTAGSQDKAKTISARTPEKVYDKSFSSNIDVREDENVPMKSGVEINDAADKSSGALSPNTQLNLQDTKTSPHVAETKRSDCLENIVRNDGNKKKEKDKVGKIGDGSGKEKETNNTTGRKSKDREKAEIGVESGKVKKEKTPVKRKSTTKKKNDEKDENNEKGKGNQRRSTTGEKKSSRDMTKVDEDYEKEDSGQTHNNRRITEERKTNRDSPKIDKDSRKEENNQIRIDEDSGKEEIDQIRVDEDSGKEEIDQTDNRKSTTEKRSNRDTPKIGKGNEEKTDQTDNDESITEERKDNRNTLKIDQDSEQEEEDQTSHRGRRRSSAERPKNTASKYNLRKHTNVNKEKDNKLKYHTRSHSWSFDKDKNQETEILPPGSCKKEAVGIGVKRNSENVPGKIICESLVLRRDMKEETPVPDMEIESVDKIDDTQEIPRTPEPLYTKLKGKTKWNRRLDDLGSQLEDAGAIEKNLDGIMQEKPDLRDKVLFEEEMQSQESCGKVLKDVMQVVPETQTQNALDHMPIEKLLENKTDASNRPTNQASQPIKEDTSTKNRPARIHQQNYKVGRGKSESARELTGQEKDNDDLAQADSPFDLLTPGQGESQLATSLDILPLSGSECGQGFYLTQEKESNSLLPLVSQHLESGSDATTPVNIHEMDLCDLSAMDLEDIDYNLLTKLSDELNSEGKEDYLNVTPDYLKFLPLPQTPKKEIQPSTTTHTNDPPSSIATQEGSREQVVDGNDIQSPKRKKKTVNVKSEKKSGLNSTQLAKSRTESENMRMLMKTQQIQASKQESDICELMNKVDEFSQISGIVAEEDKGVMHEKNNEDELLAVTEDEFQTEKKTSKSKRSVAENSHDPKTSAALENIEHSKDETSSTEAKSSPQKTRHERQTPPKRPLNKKMAIQKEDKGENAKPVQGMQPVERKIIANKLKRKRLTLDKKQQQQQHTPASARNPHLPWFLSDLQDLPTPSMHDIITNSDSSTPCGLQKLRQGLLSSGPLITTTTTTPGSKSGVKRYEKVPCHPPQWYDDLPLPGMTHGKTKTQGISCELLKDMSDASLRKIEKSPKKRKNKSKDLKPRESPSTNVGSVDSMPWDRRNNTLQDDDDDEGAAGLETSFTKTSEFMTEDTFITSDAQQSRTGDTHTSVTYKTDEEREALSLGHINRVTDLQDTKAIEPSTEDSNLTNSSEESPTISNVDASIIDRTVKNLNDSPYPSRDGDLQALQEAEATETTNNTEKNIIRSSIRASLIDRIDKETEKSSRTHKNRDADVETPQDANTSTLATTIANTSDDKHQLNTQSDVLDSLVEVDSTHHHSARDVGLDAPPGSVNSSAAELDVAARSDDWLFDLDLTSGMDWLKDLPLPCEENTEVQETDKKNGTAEPEIERSIAVSKQQRTRRRKTDILMDWIKDLPLHQDNKQPDIETHLKSDVTAAPTSKLMPKKHQSKSKKKRLSSTERDENLPKPPHYENDMISTHKPSISTSNKRKSKSKKKDPPSITGRTEDLPSPLHNENITSPHKPSEISPKKRQSKSKNNKSASITGRTEDLPRPLHDENDITSPHKPSEISPRKHQSKSKNDNPASLVERSEENVPPPPPEENIIASPERRIPRNNIAQDDMIKTSTNLDQFVEDERNSDTLIEAAENEKENRSLHPPSARDEATVNGNEPEGDTDTRALHHSKTDTEKSKKKKGKKANKKSVVIPDTNVADEEHTSKNMEQTPTVDVISKKELKKRKKKCSETSSRGEVTALGNLNTTVEEENINQEERTEEEEPDEIGGTLSPLRKKRKTTEGKTYKNRECDKVAGDEEEKTCRDVKQKESERGKRDKKRRKHGKQKAEEYEENTTTIDDSVNEEEKMQQRAEEYGKNATKNYNIVNEEEETKQRAEEYEENTTKNYENVNEEEETESNLNQPDEDPEDATPYLVETAWDSDANLTVRTKRPRESHTHKKKSIHSGERLSKRQKTEGESSRMEGDTSITSDQSFSITVCNEVESLKNIRITLSRSMESEENTPALDKGLKVQVQFTEQPDLHQQSVTRNESHLSTPVKGQPPHDPKQRVVKSDWFTPTPQKMPPIAKQRKLFDKKD